MAKKEENNRQLIAIFSFIILITIIITTIDWTVTNFYHLALRSGDYTETVMWYFFCYQITIFIIGGGIIMLFLVVIQINYTSKELNIDIEGFHYFKFLKEIPKKNKLEVILPALSFGILYVFNFEDILWFRLFYGPNMSYRIDDLFVHMWWLDLHLAGLLGRLMGFGTAVTLSLMIISAIGYAIFCIMWYKLIHDKWLFIHLSICVLFIFNIDVVFGIIGPPIPYIRVSLMGLLYLTTFIIIVIKNTK